MNDKKEVNLFDGFIFKSASDLDKPFRRRFCTVSFEEISVSDQINIKTKRSSFPIRRASLKFDQFSRVLQTKPSSRRLVFTYYKKKYKTVLGKFILDDSDFREVKEGIKEFQNVVCVKLTRHQIQRDLYLCFETIEEKGSFLNVLRENIGLKSHSDIEDYDKLPIKDIPNDEDNPLLKELFDISKKIRSESEINQEVSQDPLDDFYTSGICIRDSGYSTASIRFSNGSSFSRNSVYSTASSTYICSTYEAPKLRVPSLSHDVVVHIDISPSASLPNQNCIEFLADESIEEDESLMPKKRYFSM